MADRSKPNRDTTHSRRPLIESPPRHRDHHLKIQTLIVDNQRLAATHVALKQELAVALQDLRHYSVAATKIKGDRAAEVRGVFEKAVKLEQEVGLLDELRVELVQVRGDVQKLGAENKELTEKLNDINGELAEERSNLHQVSMVKAEIEAMRKEIQKGRAAVEYEKKVYAANMEQGQAMEKSRVSMVLEIEKLKVDLANATKKAMAAAAAAATNTPGAGYGAGYMNHDMGYGGNAYPGPYVGHQVHGGVDPHYGPGPVPHGPYDMQHHMVNPQYPYDMQHPNAHG
ncbi:protein FLX-like 1 [Bidens hawaiensis]|uniref:protein FLX-like 1 n=1 Tax=Bidens hawaiensis TaxID=980011 RepID=UPI00404A792E